MTMFTHRFSDVEARANGTGNGLQDAAPSPGSEPAVPLVTTASTSSPVSNENGPNSTPIASEKLEEFLDKYDPRPHNVPSLFPMSEHRAMMRTMYLDNILHNTARLHKHNWILMSQNEKYKELCTPERWKLIQEDLESYTKSVQTYEYWLTSMIQRLELDPVALPPTFSTYGKTLAILECASHPSHLSPSEAPFLQGLSEGLTLSHANWSSSAAYFRHLREVAKVKHDKKKGLVSRVVMAIFGGATLIVPMLIMVLDQRRVTTLLTTSAFTLGIGLILAFWMEDAGSKDIIAATAAYAAVLVVFVGSGSVNNT